MRTPDAGEHRAQLLEHTGAQRMTPRTMRGLQNGHEHLAFLCVNSSRDAPAGAPPPRRSKEGTTSLTLTPDNIILQESLQMGK